MADTNPAHYAFWDAAGLVASGLILLAGVAGLVILAVQLRRLYRGRR